MTGRRRLCPEPPGLKAVAVVYTRLLNSPVARSDFPGAAAESFSSAAEMNDKPKLRDKFFSSPTPPREARPASPNIGEQPKKESLEQILEDGFKADMRRLKMGCLLVWHIGGLLVLLFVLIVSLMALYDAIHKAIFG